MIFSPDNAILGHPLTRRIGWVGYAIVFYLCGESFFIWLLEPAQFSGGIRWLGVVLFPFVLIGFFFTQRKLGCGTGHCRIASDDDPHQQQKKRQQYTPPPGF